MQNDYNVVTAPWWTNRVCYAVITLCLNKRMRIWTVRAYVRTWQTFNFLRALCSARLVFIHVLQRTGADVNPSEYKISQSVKTFFLLHNTVLIWIEWRRLPALFVRRVRPSVCLECVVAAASSPTMRARAVPVKTTLERNTFCRTTILTFCWPHSVVVLHVCLTTVYFQRRNISSFSFCLISSRWLLLPQFTQLWS